MRYLSIISYYFTFICPNINKEEKPKSPTPIRIPAWDNLGQNFPSPIFHKGSSAGQVRKIRPKRPKPQKPMKPDTDDDQGHDDYTERMLDRADYLRTERKDREWEDRTVKESLTVALIPCPFCGSSGTYPEDMEPIGELYCQCSSDTCRTFGPSAKTWSEAGRLWNREDENKYRVIAGELIAAIRVNVLRGTFATATIEQIDEWLKPWTDKMR